MPRAIFFQRSIRLRRDSPAIINSDILVPATNAKFIRIDRMRTDAVQLHFAIVMLYCQQPIKVNWSVMFHVLRAKSSYLFGLLCRTSTSRTTESSPALRNIWGVSVRRDSLWAGPRWRPNRRVEWNAPPDVSSAKRICPSRAQETMCISPHNGKNLACIQNKIAL